MKIIKEILRWKPSEKTTALFGVLIFGAVLVVMLRLTKFTTPYYDDYSYGRMVHIAVMNQESFWQIISVAITNTKNMWYAWQGTFSSIFLMSLMPAAFGEQYYFWGPLLLILFFSLSIFLLMGVLMAGVFKANRWNTLAVQMITELFVFTLIYSAQQGFYWYNAGVHYIGGHSFFMIFISLIILAVFVNKNKLLVFSEAVLAIPFALLVSGSNYITSLQGAVIIATIIILAIIKRRKKLLWVIPSYAMYIFGFYRNLIAPGNKVRASFYIGCGYPAPQAILKSFEEAIKWFPKFTGFTCLLFMVLVFPIIFRIVKKTSFQFKYPGLVFLWSVCVYATGFTPNLYSTGRIDLARVINVIKISLQLLLLINEVYIIGYVYQKRSQRVFIKWQGNVFWWSYGIWLAGLLFMFFQTADRIGNFAPYGAYYYVHSGEANNYRQEYLQRVERLRGDEKEVEVFPYLYRPWFLCKKVDLSEDPLAEQNVMVAEYYGKASVRMKVEETE